MKCVYRSFAVVLLASPLSGWCDAGSAGSNQPSEHSNHEHGHHHHSGGDAPQSDPKSGHEQQGSQPPAPQAQPAPSEHNQHGGDQKHPPAAPANHSGHTVDGLLGVYPMARDGSGTAWQPDSSPHEGLHFSAGGWDGMVHGSIYAVYDHQSGPRGDSKWFSASELMLQGRRDLAGGVFALRTMLSLDPLGGRSGYPLLFQTGETANGRDPLVDRQHPHDLFMELAASYSFPVTDSASIFLYGGPVGEPALGPVAFVHRASSIGNPEAPIGHHWLDATHITSGVVTLGGIYRNAKLEGSVFHGRESDQNRYDFDTGALDSWSTRLTVNPSSDLSAQVSHGHIRSPEQLEPDVDVNRTTASASWNTSFLDRLWFSTLAWGRNQPTGGHRSSNAWLLESSVKISSERTVFARYENVDKTELFGEGDPLAGRSFNINKVSVGTMQTVGRYEHYSVGVGGLVSLYATPRSMDATYGSNPWSAMVFARVGLF